MTFVMSSRYRGMHMWRLRPRTCIKRVDDEERRKTWSHGNHKPTVPRRDSYLFHLQNLSPLITTITHKFLHPFKRFINIVR